jgi:hypothetical protein
VVVANLWVLGDKHRLCFSGFETIDILEHSEWKEDSVN